MKKPIKSNIAMLLAFVIGIAACPASGTVTAAEEPGRELSAAEESRDVLQKESEGAEEESSENPEGEEDTASDTDITEKPEENEEPDSEESSDSRADSDTGENEETDPVQDETEESGTGESDTGEPETEETEESKAEEPETEETEESKAEEPDTEETEESKGEESDTEETEETKAEEPETEETEESKAEESETEETEESKAEESETEETEESKAEEPETEETEETEESKAEESETEETEESEPKNTESNGSESGEPETEYIEQYLETEAAVGLQIPKQLTVTIDPWEIEKRGQVYSEQYLIENTGNVPIQLVLRETISSLREEETVIWTDAAGLHESEKKSVYVQMNFGNGEQLVLTEEGTEYLLILEPGTQLSFWFSGEVNENALQPWGEDEIGIEITYSWSTEETVSAEVSENGSILPDESGNLKENTNMGVSAGDAAGIRPEENPASEPAAVREDEDLHTADNDKKETEGTEESGSGTAPKKD